MDRKLPTDSKIKKSGFNNFMTKLFGFRRSNDNKNIEFTQVDVDSSQRVGQALINELSTPTGPLHSTAEKLFNYWLNDTTDNYTELSNRKQRVDQLAYAVLNDPYIGQTVQLYADEACQLDEQDTIINIETPDPRMTRDMYNLLNLWGITQTRIRSTIENLATYGDAFWANKITENGVERIIPLQQLQVTDRLEFNPIKVLEVKKRREGNFWNFANKNYLIRQMLDQMEDTGDFADLFDSKLFGFTIDSELVVPPWAVTHFRVGYDLGQFYPFGTSPILGALAPFKQTQSTITLQSMARMMSFPITLYQVKTSDSMDEGKQFNVVNNVREKFENIGVTPKIGSSEVWTVNTEVWIPDGLLKVDVIKPDINFDNVDDLKFYNNRTAVASGMPTSFWSEAWYDVNQSGKSLLRQYKPFARKTYSLQSAFLSGVSDLFRLHFAITGAYDFRTPFTLSMKFPAEEESEDRQNARTKSLELAKDVINIVKASIGASEEESLPPDIVRDIIGKYSFLDATDIMKWTRDAKFAVANASDFEVEGDTDMGEGGISVGGEESSVEEAPAEEIETTPLGESIIEAQLLREEILNKNYEENRNKIYFQALRECAVDNFVREGQHILVCNQISDSCDLMLETLEKQSKQNKTRFKESFETSFNADDEEN